MLKRTEMRVMKCVVEYEIPKDLSEAESAELLDKYQSAEELNYPCRITQINSNPPDTLLAFVILANGTDIQRDAIPMESFLHTIQNSLSGEHELKKLAHELATVAMKENYSDLIEQQKMFVFSEIFQKKVAERETILFEHLKIAIKQIHQK